MEGRRQVAGRRQGLRRGGGEDEDGLLGGAGEIARIPCAADPFGREAVPDGQQGVATLDQHDPGVVVAPGIAGSLADDTPGTAVDPVDGAPDGDTRAPPIREPGEAVRPGLEIGGDAVGRDVLERGRQGLGQEEVNRQAELVGALDEEQVGTEADRAIGVEPAAATHRLGGETLQAKPDGRAQAFLVGQVTVADET